ncbi:MAG: tyrosine-type recombinase/integrase [Verrucomicrobia bacterium]|nr:tyrosine-type recombinase/integrase [Verrucomicrobiota bacterium]
MWVRYWDHRRGKWRNRTTKVRANDPDRARKLAKFIHRIEGENLSATEVPAGTAPDARQLARWVPAWLRATYAESESTLAQYEQRWRAVLAFLQDRRVFYAADVQREHADGYIAWRTTLRKGKAGKSIARNTCIAELKVLAMVLFEAVRRGEIAANPLARLRLRRSAARIKPEFTDAQIGQVRAQLREAPEWMGRAFEIALYTGLRHAETRLRLADVDFSRGEIFVGDPKGGPKRAYTIPLPDELRPMLQQLARAGILLAWSPPTGKGVMPAGMQWRRLFDAAGLGDHSFHSTRVTFISRGCRAGIPEGMMRRLVNHASAEIHAIYQRVEVEDLKQWRPRITLPPPPEVA